MNKEVETYNPTEESVVVYRSADNAVQLDVQLADETVWLSQRQMAALFNTTTQNITVHIRNIYKEEELAKASTCKDFLQVQKEGGRQITQRVLKDAGKRLFAFTQMDSAQISAIKARL